MWASSFPRAAPQELEQFQSLLEDQPRWRLLIACLATIAVHFAAGCTHLTHLLPAYGGLAAVWLAAALTFAWMGRREAR